MNLCLASHQDQNHLIYTLPVGVSLQVVMVVVATAEQMVIELYGYSYFAYHLSRAFLVLMSLFLKSMSVSYEVIWLHIWGVVVGGGEGQRCIQCHRKVLVSAMPKL